jgi:hypothetical protein
VIFLLRLVAADRRTRRVPQAPSARKTVGMIEDEASIEPPARGEAPVSDGTAAVDDDAPPLT